MVEPQSAGPDRPGQLLRLWVEFDVQAVLGLREGMPWGIAGDPGWLLGVGVSGYDQDDCLALLREAFFSARPMAPIRRTVATVDVTTLPEHGQERWLGLQLVGYGVDNLCDLLGNPLVGMLPTAQV